MGVNKYKNNFEINKKKLLKDYNDEKIFKLRINRLQESKTIKIKNKNIIILNKNIFMIYIFYNFFKKFIRNDK